MMRQKAHVYNLLHQLEGLFKKNYNKDKTKIYLFFLLTKNNDGMGIDVCFLLEKDVTMFVKHCFLLHINIFHFFFPFSYNIIYLLYNIYKVDVYKTDNVE